MDGVIDTHIATLMAVPLSVAGYTIVLVIMMAAGTSTVVTIIYTLFWFGAFTMIVYESEHRQRQMDRLRDAFENLKG